ncbi:tail fiber protein [Xenorhabdus budapestensis]|uniref:gp53-like domain-containing protein n=1 Tax=Xenorhabdus budapestensis TaxID=290110 RepID=UPI003A86F941
MQKIGDITNTADSNGEYTNGNVAAGIPPTILESGWFNTVQREMINVLLKAGMKPDKTNDAQLSEAIRKLVSDSQVALTDSFGQSSSLAASQKLVTHANDNATNRLEKVKNGADIEDKNTFINNLGLRDTVKQAQNAVPNSRKVNGKSLTSDVNLTPGNIGAQPAGNYTLKGDSYTKQESDSKYGKKNKGLMAKNGWFKCEDSGFICQWGYTKNKLNEAREWVQFPIKFPTECFGGLATPVANNRIGGNMSAYFGDSNKEGAWVTMDLEKDSDASVYVFWIAIGY